MPRPPRLIVEGGIYHVISRGVKQAQIFLEDNDRKDSLRLIKLAQEEYAFTLHRYCLMDNHFHLLLQPEANTLSKIMHCINSTYGNRFNKRHGVTGHVLQGRFHSILVQGDAYMTTVSRYIDLNPVRAGIVDKPEDYRWSSYRATVLGLPEVLVDPSFLLGYFGKEPNRRRDAYRRFVEDMLQKPEPISEKILWKMRTWGNPLAKLTTRCHPQRPVPNDGLLLR